MEMHRISLLNTPLDVIPFSRAEMDGILFGFLTDFSQVINLNHAYIIRVSQWTSMIQYKKFICLFTKHKQKRDSEIVLPTADGIGVINKNQINAEESENRALFNLDEEQTFTVSEIEVFE